MIIKFPIHCHCTESCFEIIECSRSIIQYNIIQGLIGSAKREKGTKKITNENNRRIIEIKAIDEPTYEDIKLLDQDDDDEEDEE